MAKTVDNWLIVPAEGEPVIVSSVLHPCDIPPPVKFGELEIPVAPLYAGPREDVVDLDDEANATHPAVVAYWRQLGGVPGGG